MDPDDVDIWFRVNNIIPEKMDLYYDFSFSLYYLILDTYLGDDKNSETKIVLSDEDNLKHFEWCWNKTIENFQKEEITFNKLATIITITNYLYILSKFLIHLKTFLSNYINAYYKFL